jgi:hypothetical protein
MSITGEVIKSDVAVTLGAFGVEHPDSISNCAIVRSLRGG